MCGRYVQVSSPELLARRFGVHEVALPAAQADYNVAPRKQVPVVVQREPDRRVLEPMRWGLVPSWAKDPKIGDRLVNARSESLGDKPAYKHAFRAKRCLIPADGFYEWRSVPGSRRKQPVFFHARDGEPVAFAGLWDAWRDRDDPDAEWLRSCVIVTTRANRMMAPVHDRMPVILPESAWDAWLDPSNHDMRAIPRLLEPPPDDLLEAWPVSTDVNNVRTNGPQLVQPVDPQAPSLTER